MQRMLVRQHKSHNAGVNALNTRMPNAMIQPARATPRNEGKKKGLTIRTNSQASIMETPKTTAHPWDCDCGSTRNPQNLSASRQNKKTTTTTVSKTRNNRLQYLVESETYALILPVAVYPSCRRRKAFISGVTWSGGAMDTLL